MGKELPVADSLGKWEISFAQDTLKATKTSWVCLRRASPPNQAGPGYRQGRIHMCVSIRICLRTQILCLWGTALFPLTLEIGDSFSWIFHFKKDTVFDSCISEVSVKRCTFWTNLIFTTVCTLKPLSCSGLLLVDAVVFSCLPHCPMTSIAILVKSKRQNSGLGSYVRISLGYLLILGTV